MVAGNLYQSGSSTYTAGNFYAPRYYDSNLTTYYLDPSSSSYTYRVYASSDMRSPVFYDGNNTSYRFHGDGWSRGESLSIDNNITAGSFTYSSDIKLKKDISKIDNPLEKIMALRGVEFT